MAFGGAELWGVPCQQEGWQVRGSQRTLGMSDTNPPTPGSGQGGDLIPSRELGAGWDCWVGRWGWWLLGCWVGVVALGLVVGVTGLGLLGWGCWVVGCGCWVSLVGLGQLGGWGCWVGVVALGLGGLVVLGSSGWGWWLQYLGWWLGMLGWWLGYLGWG